MLTECYRCKIDGKEFFVPVEIIDGKWTGSKFNGHRIPGIRGQKGVQVYEKTMKDFSPVAEGQPQAEQANLFGMEG